jgi:tetratricopeptide (TPR) repeat protein
MDVFRQGDVQGSIEYFDEALTIGGAKIEPYLWQRGLSLYYAGKYKEGAEQFRTYFHLVLDMCMCAGLHHICFLVRICFIVR